MARYPCSAGWLVSPWPSFNGVGYINIDLWHITVLISAKTPNLEGATVITAAPPAEACTEQYVDAANATLEAEGLNTTGEGFAPITVTLKEGGT
ncbi:MAG: hypothetical protein FJW97_01445 [Actinobacteria bacterium]|nr:hypothetical protein [Actinomycetota bacterium]